MQLTKQVLVAMRKLPWVLILILTPHFAAAQDDARNELGLSIGAEIVPDTETTAGIVGIGPITPARQQLSTSVVFGVNYARKLAEGEAAAWYLEFPIAAAPSHNVTSTVSFASIGQATLFITPAVRAQFRPKTTFQPWLSFGGGYALFEGSEELANGTTNDDRFENAFALQFGGGFDVRTPLKILAPITLRFEVRDFYTLHQGSLGAGLGENQHSINVKGGFVLRW
jgi:hypothetical protein